MIVTALKLIFSVTLLIQNVYCMQVIEFHASNFELALNTYRYLVVLFHDESVIKNGLLEEWNIAAENLPDDILDCAMAQVASDDPGLDEVLEAYSISIPSIKVFRRGLISEWDGPIDAQGIVEHIEKELKPSVTFLNDTEDMKSIIMNNDNDIPSIIGFFPTDTDTERLTDSGTMEPWEQFVAAADSTRGLAIFYAITSEELLSKIDYTSLPILYMISKEHEGGMAQYKGEILHMNIVDWVLRQSTPSVDELTFSTASGELFRSQFFGSPKLKYILLLHPSLPDSIIINAVDMWKSVVSNYEHDAIFAYLVEEVDGVLDYFQITNSELPQIVALEPTKEYKYVSNKLVSFNPEDMHAFISGVLDGSTERLKKSESISSSSGTGVTESAAKYATKAVGNNVNSIVGNLDKDVLLFVYNSGGIGGFGGGFGGHCSKCAFLAPTIEVLAKAVQAETRIEIAKIDAALNDIPSKEWNVNQFPTVLWFKSSDKQDGEVIPRSYWDAGTSLSEFLAFVVRESSFDPNTLRVAMQEQLGTLIDDEDQLRVLLEEEDRVLKRNVGRLRYENEMVDYLMGEIIFDGTRLHLIGVISGIFFAITLVSYSMFQKIKQS